MCGSVSPDNEDVVYVMNGKVWNVMLCSKQCEDMMQYSVDDASPSLSPW